MAGEQLGPKPVDIQVGHAGQQQVVQQEGGVAQQEHGGQEKPGPAGGLSLKVGHDQDEEEQGVHQEGGQVEDCQLDQNPNRPFPQVLELGPQDGIPPQQEQEEEGGLLVRGYAFNGKPEVMYLSSNGPKGEKDLYLDYYDMDMNWLDITLKPHLHSKVKATKPNNWEELVGIAKKLATPFPFVRIDLYDVNGKVYISEFTFIPTGGNMQLEPEHYIDDWGGALQL